VNFARFVWFLPAAFLAVVIYFLLELILEGALRDAGLVHIVPTQMAALAIYMFAIHVVVPVLITLAIASLFGAWRRGAERGFQVAVVLVALVISYPARFVMGYLVLFLMVFVCGGAEICPD